MFQAFNILRYEVGQLYKSHYDAFSPAEYGPQKSQRVHLKQKKLFILFFIFYRDHGTFFPNNIWFITCLLVCAHTKT
jgi:hypothetical protein